MGRLPTLHCRKIIQALQRGGFEIDRQSGSHVILRNQEKNRMTCVPVHKDVKRRLLKAILEQAGISESEFETLL